MPPAQGHQFTNEKNTHSHFQNSQSTFISFVFITFIDPPTSIALFRDHFFNLFSFFRLVFN